MNQKANLKLASGRAAASRMDLFKWVFSFVLLITGLVANAYYGQVAWAIRLAIGIVLIAIIALLIFQTQKGRVFWQFVQSAQRELMKVTWPTRQETIQTTLIVVAMVVFAAIVLWGIDTLFFWVVGWLTGQRG